MTKTNFNKSKLKFPCVEWVLKLPRPPFGFVFSRTLFRYPFLWNIHTASTRYYRYAVLPPFNSRSHRFMRETNSQEHGFWEFLTAVQQRCYRRCGGTDYNLRYYRFLGTRKDQCSNLFIPYETSLDLIRAVQTPFLFDLDRQRLPLCWASLLVQMCLSPYATHSRSNGSASPPFSLDLRTS